MDAPKDWPAPDEYMLELGRLMTIWGSLEVNVLMAISKFAGYDERVDPRAFIMVNHSNMNQKIEIVGTLCEQLADTYPHLKNYDSVIKKLKAAQKARNGFAHNGMSMNEETGRVETMRMSARGVLKTEVREVKVSDLRDATAKVHIASCALYSLVEGKEVKPIWERDP